jgi:predicted nucleotidyltransferase
MAEEQSHRVPDACVVEFREMLQSVLGENFVRLYHFGSRIEGGAGRDSDYDVLCVTRRPLTRDEDTEVMARRIDLQLDRDVFFDPHFFTVDEMQSPTLGRMLLVEHVLAAGVVV